MTDKRRKTKYLICFMAVWTVLMAAAFYFCTLKQGFHEDEYYTYYSTARTNGFYVEDGKWMDSETYRKEFVVLPGERFQYGLVKQVQSWDVHPPMYYWVFHTAASLVPGVFSKWIGLSINLLFHGINLILLTYLSYLVCERSGKTALFVTLFYGLTPAAMSGVVFIRMYEMLTVFVLLCAVLHVRAVQRLQSEEGRGEKLPVVRLLLPMAAVTYVGFLTQYYYFLFLFFMAIAFCSYLLWRDRNLYNCLRYGAGQGIAFILAYLTYPTCLGQMFRGQRGAQATENFFDLSNTVTRFRFFFDLLDEYVFGNLLSVFLLLIVVLALAVYFRRHRRRADVWSGEMRADGGGQSGGMRADGGGQSGGMNEDGGWQPAGRIIYGMLLFTAAGYFFTVAKTALLLGNTSNRYQLPIYGIIILLLFWTIEGMWQSLARIRHRCLPAAVAAVCLVIDLSGLHSDRVAFLYPQAGEAVALAREQAAADIPVVYVYKPGEEWCVWAVADELMEYDRVYFVSAASEDAITEPVIANADAVVSYTPRYDDLKEEEAQSMRIASGNHKLSWEYLQYLHKYCIESYHCRERRRME
ncbi:MAG: glycosyltransferase family 39 protein [Lachnospiraceae bacterium]|nr:glycosyltransferase family 39 protein [Lachnospiraceae bacterium]